MNKYMIKKDAEGKVIVARATNYKAPGLLRVFINDTRAVKTGKKMPDIRKDPTFRALIASYVGKPVETLSFAFNGNLGSMGAVGILIQDTTAKPQSSIADEIEVTVEADANDADQPIVDLTKTPVN